jgi:hypothetical protein
LPERALPGIKLNNLDVDTAGAKAELNHAFPFRPPAGKTLKRGQCLIGISQGRRFDSDFV